MNRTSPAIRPRGAAAPGAIPLLRQPAGPAGLPVNVPGDRQRPSGAAGGPERPCPRARSLAAVEYRDRPRARLAGGTTAPGQAS